MYKYWVFQDRQLRKIYRRIQQIKEPHPRYDTVYGIIRLSTIEKGRTLLNKYNKYHLLKPSIWPFFSSIAVLLLVYGLLFWFYTGKIFTSLFGFLEVLLVMFFWWLDVSHESGEQTEEVSRGLKLGMALFIVSEVMFFFSFFWAFFHVSLVPGFELGGVWPPIGLQHITVDTWGIPLLNTFLLLSSGVTVTGAHHAFLSYFEKENFVLGWRWRDIKRYYKFRKKYFLKMRMVIRYFVMLKKKLTSHFFVGMECMLLTVILAMIFTLLQAYEYVESPICMSDGAYGSTFFIMTGFHGLHVLIGTIFLIVCSIRLALNHFYFKNSVGLECAIWYWHFVDVVWLFLFVSIYMWGNSFSTNNNKSFFFYPADRECDFARRKQIGFQDHSTLVMENIVDFHHGIMVTLIFIFILVCAILTSFINDSFQNRFNHIEYNLSSKIFDRLSFSYFKNRINMEKDDICLINEKNKLEFFDKDLKQVNNNDFDFKKLKKKYVG